MLSQPSLNETLWRERARTDRNGSPFSLVLIHLDHQSVRRGELEKLRRALVRAMRWTDQLGWYDDQVLGLVMPDTRATGAWAFTRRFHASISKHQGQPGCRVFTYPSNWLEDDDSSDGRSSDAEDATGFLFNGRGRQADGNHPPLRPGAVGSSPSNGKYNGNGRGNARTVTRSGSKAEFRSTCQANVCLFDEPSCYFHAELETNPIASLEPLLVESTRSWKRPLDLIGAGLGLVLLWPVMALIALAVKLTSPGPLLFCQRRCGRGGRPFTIYKFRSMIPDAERHQQALAAHNEQDGPAFKIERDPRITPVGRFLRNTSLDELPQLINVLRGDMSLVGPRPLPVAETNRCAPWHRRRLTVKPGLTCLWQIGGRSTVDFDQWMRMDQRYLRRSALIYDLWLIVATIPAVILQRGAK